MQKVENQLRVERVLMLKEVVQQTVPIHTLKEQVQLQQETIHMLKDLIQ